MKNLAATLLSLAALSLGSAGYCAAAVVAESAAEISTVTCHPLTVCAVELAAGEKVRSTLIGDSEKWIVKPVDPGSDRPLLAIKPSACGLRTNLILTTDLRTAQIALTSPPCDDPEHGTAPIAPILTLPAPAAAEILSTYSAAPALPPTPPMPPMPPTASTSGVASSPHRPLPAAVHTVYKVQGGPRKLRKALRIWDDRLHLYVSLPADVAAVAPSALLVSRKPSGSDVSGLPVVPATYADGLLRTDTLPRFDALWLVVGSEVIRIEPVG